MDPQFSIEGGIWAALREIDQLQGRIAALPIPPGWLAMARESALLTEALHTTRIEGSQITLNEATAALAGLTPDSARPDDVQELLNYRAAYEQAVAYVATGRPVTQAFLRELHRDLVSEVRGGAAAPGEYRKVQNYVVDGNTGRVIYTPPPANVVPERMAGLVDWLATTELHPVLLAGTAQFELVDIHPFLDGNGRIARLLAITTLHGNGYALGDVMSLSEEYDRDRSGYYDAIQSVRTDSRDHTQWLRYFTRGLVTQLESAVARMEAALAAERSATRRVTDHERQILSTIERSGTVSLRDLGAAIPTVPRRTLQYAVGRLIADGLVVAEGSTAARRYRAPEAGA